MFHFNVDQTDCGSLVAAESFLTPFWQITDWSNALPDNKTLATGNLVLPVGFSVTWQTAASKMPLEWNPKSKRMAHVSWNDVCCFVDLSETQKDQFRRCPH